MTVYHLTQEGRDGEVLTSFALNGACNLHAQDSPVVRNYFDSYAEGQKPGLFVFTTSDLPRSHATHSARSAYIGANPVRKVASANSRPALISIDSDPARNHIAWRPDYEFEAKTVYDFLSQTITPDVWTQIAATALKGNGGVEYRVANDRANTTLTVTTRSDTRTDVDTVSFGKLDTLGSTTYHAKAIQVVWDILYRDHPDLAKRLNQQILSTLLSGSDGETHALKYVGDRPLPVANMEVLDSDKWQTVSMSALPSQSRQAPSRAYSLIAGTIAAMASYLRLRPARAQSSNGTSSVPESDGGILMPLEQQVANGINYRTDWSEQRRNRPGYTAAVINGRV